MELASRMTMTRFQTIWIQMQAGSKPMDESSKTGQTLGTKWHFTPKNITNCFDTSRIILSKMKVGSSVDLVIKSNDPKISFQSAGVLSGDVSDIVLLDVTPLSIGLETLGGVMTKIIPRNTTLPTSKSEVFSTAADGQTSVEINVLQGEREFVRDNKSLGSFRLDGIPPAPRGVPQIEVKFDIDANGILSVTAMDKGTGKKQDITITGASTLPSDEVERMVNEAEKFANEDKEKRDAIDTKNQADSVVYQTEKQLKELGDKVPAPVKEKVEAKLGELREAINGGSTQTIKDAMAALNQEVMQLGQSLYNQPGAPGTPPGAEPAGSSDKGPEGPEGDVIDADFTDSK
ncbi:putative Heat shock protein 70 family [Helianthus debilis subsp. tardiflorus]